MQLQTGEFMNEFELKILNFIQDNLKCEFLDFLMPKITLLGEGGVFWIVTALILLCFKKTRKTGAIMGVALALGFVIGNLTLKPLIARVRPYDMPGVNIELLVKSLGDKSFPSGHTLACFEGATALYIANKRIGIPVLFMALAVAFSRLYLYVHYPSDVIVGALLGILFGVLASVIVNRVIYSYYSKTNRKTKG